MICPDCGRENEEGAHLCSQCGRDLSDAHCTAAASEQAEQTDSRQADDQPLKRAGAHGAHSIVKPGNPKATAALVCGIASIVLSFTVVLGFAFGCAAIVLGGLAVKEGPNRKARRGAICSVVGMVLSALMLVVSLMFGIGPFASKPADLPTENDTTSASAVSIGSSSSASSVASSSSSSANTSSSSASASSSSSSNSTATSSKTEVPLTGSYRNARFGFSTGVPEGFVQGEESQDGDGVTFTNSALGMTVHAYGTNNTEKMNEDAVVKSVWNGSSDSIKQTGDGYVFIYQYDSTTEYFYWIYIGAGSIDRMEISYPLQDDNNAEMTMAETFMESFTPGDLSVSH